MNEENRMPAEEAAANACPADKPAALDNPLPDPVPGRRDPMEFPIAEIPGDDYDFPAREADDFDI